jgi:hypothetical protein
MKRILKYIPIVIGIAIVDGTFFVVLFEGDPERLGGMSSPHRATDYDPELTSIAREAAPLIAAVGEFIAGRGA